MPSRPLSLELKRTVIKELSDDRDQLLRCRLVSKEFHDLATPRSLETILISTKHMVPTHRTDRDSTPENAFIGNLPESSPVLKHVKEIVVDLCGLMGILEQQEGTFQLSMFKTLSKIASQKPFNLLELDIRGLVSRREERLPLEGIRPLLTNLDTVQFYILTDCCDGVDAFEDVHAEFFQSEIVSLLSATQKLTDLSLHLDTGMYMFTTAQWSSLHFPALKRLHLNNIVFEIYSAHSSSRHYPAEDFTLRHGDTLETLDLSHSCIAADEQSALRTWAMIWAGFAQGLPKLRLFEFDPLPGVVEGKWGNELIEGYCWLSSGMNSGYYATDFEGYGEPPVDSGDLEEDKAAFESLQETIRARGNRQRTKNSPPPQNSEHNDPVLGLRTMVNKSVSSNPNNVATQVPAEVWRHLFGVHIDALPSDAKIRSALRLTHVCHGRRRFGWKYERQASNRLTSHVLLFSKLSTPPCNLVCNLSVMADQRHIPLELQHAILDELRDSDNMAQVLPCRLVSRDFHDIVTPFALKSIHISSKHLLPAQPTACDSNAENAFIRNLPESSPVFKHAKEIVMDLCGLIDLFKSREVKADKYDQIASMFTQLAKFPSLDTLRLHFIEKPVTWRLDSSRPKLDIRSLGTFQLSMFKTLSGVASEEPFNLLELDIQGLVARQEEHLPLEGIHPLLTNLSTLRFSILTECYDSIDEFMDGHADFFQTEILDLLTTTQELQTLVLNVDTGMYMFMTDQWESLHFPALKTLHFGNVVFEMYPTFSTRVSCIAAEENSEPRTWAMVWKGLKRGLPNLRQFEFDPLPGFAEGRGDNVSDLVEGYCWLWSGRNSGYYSTSFENYEELPFDIDEDKLMFKSLQKTIRARNDSYLNNYGDIARHVPAEVWRHLFRIHIGALPSAAKVSTALQLGQVCSSWRSIASNAPELWTDVHLSLPAEKSTAFPNAKILDLAFKNARSKHLTMELQTLRPLSVTEVSGVLGSIGTFFGQLHRAKSLKMDCAVLSELQLGDEEGFDKMIAEVPQANVLEKLELNLNGDVLEVMYFLARIYISASSLKTLVIYGSTLYYDVFDELKKTEFPFYQLTTLHVDTLTDSESFIELLFASKFLVNATFDKVSGDLCHSGSRPFLPRLKVLKIGWVEEDEMDFASIKEELFELVHAPELTELDLHFCQMKFPTATRLVQAPTLSEDWVIRTVPSDIWISIFKEVIARCFFSSVEADTENTAALRLSHVCATWHSIVHGAPELWRNVSVLFRPQRCFPSLDLVSLSLKNARSSPLRLIDLDVQSDFTQDHPGDLGTIKLFLQAGYRAESLCIRFSVIDSVAYFEPSSFDELVTQLEAEGGRWLESLVFNVDVESDSALTFLSELWCSAPLLRSLTFHVTQVSQTVIDEFEEFSFPFQQLTTLVLTTSIELVAFMSVLSSTPSLTNATFKGVFGGIDEIFGKEPVSLPALERLELIGEGEEERRSPPFTKLLAFIVAPSLKTLSLCLDHGWSSTSFTTFLGNSSPVIEHFQLGIVDCSQSDRIECLQLLPSLITLDCSLVDEDSYMRWGDHYLQDEFMNAMQGWDEESSMFTICPKLHKITVDYDSLLDISTPLFADMVGTRWRRSPLGGSDFEAVLTGVDEVGDEWNDFAELRRLLELKGLGANITIDPEVTLEELSGNVVRVQGEWIVAHQSQVLHADIVRSWKKRLDVELNQEVQEVYLLPSEVGLDPEFFNFLGVEEFVPFLQREWDLVTDPVETALAQVEVIRALRRTTPLRMAKRRLRKDWVIAKVSLDIWRCIFGCVFDASLDKMKVKAIICLSHVCSTWRSIANTAPELWTHVEVHSPSATASTAPCSDLLSIILHNARTMALTMVLHGVQYFNPDGDMSSVELFLRSLHRAKSLNLETGILLEMGAFKREIFRDLVAQMQPALLLRNLKLDMSCSSSVSISYMAKLWKPAPLLRSLEFNRSLIEQGTIFSLKQALFPFQQLSELSIDSEINLRGFFLILSFTPSLVSAKFKNIGSVFYSWEDDMPSEPVTLQALESLQMRGRGPNPNTSPPLTKVLEFIIAPSLTDLHLHFDRAWCLESFQTFVQKSSPPIERLHLDIVDSSQRDKIECLKLLPTLRALELTTELKRACQDADPSIFLAEEFCDAMQEWDESTGAFAICPKLEELTVDYPCLFDTSKRIFADMVEDRWRHSPSNIDFDLLVTEAHDLGNDQKALTEIIRLLVLKKQGLQVVIEPYTWVEELFDDDAGDEASSSDGGWE
ncbi:hypothetical protein CVT26_009320 [Gymnopilus dilepis]|uniref:Uncharacterized protein n=1 Tax=Gymnopilus dilepis TaxID=231916 RepID=A0A409YA49_9AGAR|nr:hypothetical protein CVT26_009320 [Gymnopilus dilepis]